LKLWSCDAVCDDIVDKVFRRLESEKNTRGLIKKILANTHATVDNKISDNATFYLEIRHLMVHNSSLMDKQFVDNYQSIFKHVKDGY
jgi:hypothetical protein